MIAVGIVGIVVLMVLADPMNSRLWAAAFIIGWLMIGMVALLTLVGGGEWTI